MELKKPEEIEKRIKVFINGIQRINEIQPCGDIHKLLRRKWLKQAIEKSDKVSIVFSHKAHHEDVQEGGWNIDYTKGAHNVITLKDVVGQKQIIDINNIVLKELSSVLSQAEDLYKEDYECIYHHFKNKLRALRNSKGDTK